jgi:hypothetical protein
MAAVLGMVVLLAACDTDRLLNVNVPSRVPASTLNDPSQSALMVNSTIGDFECAIGSYIVVEGLISDELADAQLGASAWPYDRRDANTQTAGVYGTSGCDNNQNPGIYLPLSTARWSADNALTNLQGWTDEQVTDRSSLIAQAATYAGFDYALLGMSMCTAAFDLGAPVDQKAMFADAEARFTTGIDAATSSGMTDMLNAALVGRARVRLFQGNNAGAIADAQKVPAGFILEASTGGDDNRRYNRIYAVTTQFGFYTVEASSRALTTEGVADPRAEADKMTTRAADAKSPIYAPAKYTSDATPIPVARYEEAQLIIAEAQGGSNAVTIVNALRAAAGVPAYTGPTDAASIKTLIVNERQRELFLEGFRNYDIQRFGLPLNPAVGAPFPDKGGTYGDTKCLPLPDIERFNNPNAG